MPRSKIRRGRENLRLSPGLTLLEAQKRITILERERDDLKRRLEDLDADRQLQAGEVRAAQAIVAEYEDAAAHDLRRAQAKQDALRIIAQKSF